jgi:hypothetical protein
MQPRGRVQRSILATHVEFLTEAEDDDAIATRSINRAANVR